MIRLTAVLLASLYAAMAIWGDAPEGDVTVTRAKAFAPTLANLEIVTEAASGTDEGLANLTEREAVQVALAAGRDRKAETTPAVAAQGAAAQLEPADDIQLWYVTGSRVNLRSGPSTSYAIVGGARQGDRAEVLSDPAESWVRIRTESGIDAWIYSRFLSETPA